MKLKTKVLLLITTIISFLMIGFVVLNVSNPQVEARSYYYENTQTCAAHQQYFWEELSYNSKYNYVRLYTCLGYSYQNNMLNNYKYLPLYRAK